MRKKKWGGGGGGGAVILLLTFLRTMFFIRLLDLRCSAVEKTNFHFNFDMRLAREV